MIRVDINVSAHVQIEPARLTIQSQFGGHWLDAIWHAWEMIGYVYYYVYRGVHSSRACNLYWQYGTPSGRTALQWR